MRILLVEDEPEIAAIIKQGLEGGDASLTKGDDADGGGVRGANPESVSSRGAGRYAVDLAEDGVTGLDLALSDAYSLIILDVMLPGIDGWEICRRLRARRNPVPILMLTARDAVDDRVRGLELGADDYLPKPFAFRELRARVHALLRRDRIHKGKTIRIDDLEIDTSSQRVTRAGKEIPLTQREYQLLEAMAAREGQVLTREMIQQRVWRDDDSYSNTVDVHVSSLRKKIDMDQDVKLIHTVHGRGYMVRGPQAEESD